MTRILRKERWFLLALLLAWSLAHASVRGDDKATPTAADKLRKALDETVTVDFVSQSFADVAQYLKDRTTVNVTVDNFALQQLGLDENPPQLRLKGDHVKLKVALQRMLAPYQLTYVLFEDSLLITTEELGLSRQLRQRVDVQFDGVPLQRALQQLARSSALNVVVDPRTAKELGNNVSLKLDDATLETAVRLLAELGGLKSVRLGNVLFVTDEARAAKIRKEEPPPPALGFAEVIVPNTPPGLPAAPAQPPAILPPGRPVAVPQSPAIRKPALPNACEAEE